MSQHALKSSRKSSSSTAADRLDLLHSGCGLHLAFHSAYAHARSMRHRTADEKLRWREGIPLIRRDGGFAHIGDDPDFMRLSAPEARWLLSIGNCQSWPEARHCCPTGVERADAILDRARVSGAIARAGECWWLTPDHRTRIQPLLLSLSHWHPAPESAIAARGSWEVQVRGTGIVADALRSVLHDSGLRLASGDASNSIVALVGGAGIQAPEALLEPGASVHGAFEDRPHLPVSVHRGHVGVGPLVIPGKTPCLRCLYLHRSDADPAWPRVVEQWRSVDQSIDADPLVAWQAAVVAAIMVRRWIDSPTHATPHRVHWRLPHVSTSSDEVTWHPGCGCRWSLLTESTEPAEPYLPRTGTSSDTR